MNRNFLGATVALLTLAGCSSVDQVPLVYVSTTKVGVNVESGSAETPGASIMIGVDLTDAAYVPVAVTRNCSGDTVEMMKLCADNLKEITVIRGESKALTENDKSRIKQLANDANALSEKMVGTAGNYSTALSNLAEAQSSVRAAESAKAQVDLLTAKKEALPEGTEFIESAQLDEATRTFSDLENRKKTLAAAGDAVDAARQALDKDKQDLRKLTNEFLNLIPRESGSSLGQSDALSVFGTFTGDINGKTGQETGSSVRLGKSFSTGVAAQHLAQGVADRERVVAEKRSDCVKAVTDGFAALPNTARTLDTYQKLLSRCDG
ncbi:hypothetical protein OIK40_02385 [Erythrobacter sp. sf7]|uniref:Lipoprotein n=1 Tax=Erythrobacter fulvus TaxID=2987523 RepID=A0ABT5JL65_9SPHN|nr:hypothetical protein [Erythrobacter fulvus]MDC8753487.1 hypothetical protein [Erythrobacter fulvus]